MKNSILVMLFMAGSLAMASAPDSTRTIKLVKRISTQTWTGDCDTGKAPCANTYIDLAFDQAGKLRLIFTDLQAKEGNGKSLPRVFTAVVVDNGETMSSFGNQYPDHADGLGLALFLMKSDGSCPVTIDINADNKVIDSHTDCRPDGP